MKRVHGLLGAFAVCAATTSAEAFCSYFNYTIGPAQVVPPSAGAGFGGSEMFLCEDHLLTGSIGVYTADTVTAVHIHGPAGTSELAPVLFTLALPAMNYVGVNIGPLTAEQELLIERELAYVDVHSVEHPNGILRGQIRHEVAVVPTAWAQVKALYRN